MSSFTSFKKVSYLLIILIVSLTIASGCSAPAEQSQGKTTNESNENTNATEPIRFGATIPITGPFAAYSTYFKNGTDLALEEINANGGINGQPLEVVYEDHKGDPSTGISALQKLITKDKVNTIFLSMTGVSLAQIPVGDQNEVLMLTGAVTYPGFATSSEWTVQDSISVYGEATEMANYLKDEVKLKTVGIIHENSELGEIYQDKFKEVAGDQIEVTNTETFDLNTTNFKGIITKVISNNPEGIIAHGTGQELQLIFKQIRELGYKGNIYSTSTTETSNTMTIAGSAAEGIVYTFSTLDTSKPKVKEFVDKYKSKYGEDPEIFGAQHYEMVHMLADILREGKRTSTEIRDAFLNIKDYDGLTGNISFDKDGLVTKDLQLKIVKNGNFETLN
ncbi:ABC transporter substrate-binding protein [Bacillus sp. Marseille-P3661]|uniref:ABC transporter substrate-binding protein n=1 Tax=Bacillus sp. Marseille-P3661 TaxID=1936234 RepID=UPI000C84013E|nr:ABC transporter substrate-binding protein [Bacillus sp. Marseille-P3661]